jgi:lysophospholipase L1-like esterase
VFAGSSIFDFWKSLSVDMAPMPVVNNAIAGYQTLNLLRHIRDITRSSLLVVLYCGSNDIRSGSSPTATSDRMRDILDNILNHTPRAHAILVGALKSPDQNKARVTQYNTLCEALCIERTPRCTYVDANQGLEDHPECFLFDNIHLTSAGYQRFAAHIRPVVEKVWTSIQQVGQGAVNGLADGSAVAPEVVSTDYA